MVRILALRWLLSSYAGLWLLAVGLFVSATVIGGCGSSGGAVDEVPVVEASHWVEHDFAELIEQFLFEDELSFAEIAEALGYSEAVPPEWAVESGEVEPATWVSVTHSSGSQVSWIGMRERQVGGMTPTRQLRFIVEGREGAKQVELVQLTDAVAEELTQRFRRHQRQLLPPGAPEGIALRRSERPATRVWDLASDVTITLQPATYEPRIMLEVYRYSRHRDGVVIRRDEYAPPGAEPVVEGPSLLDDLDGADSWREALRRQYLERQEAETRSFDAAALYVPGLDLPASEVHPRIRLVHLAYVRAASHGFEGGHLRHGRLRTHGREWLVEAADEVGLNLRGAGNAPLELEWRELQPETMLAGYRDLQSVTHEHLEGKARYAYATKQPHEGDRTLKRMLDRGELEPQRVFEIVAELREIAVPEEGLLWERDLEGNWRFITPDEKRAAEQLARIDMLVARLERRARQGERSAAAVEELVGELRELGDEGQARARVALERRWEEALAWLEAARLDSQPWRLRLYERLSEARREALNAIRNSEDYHRQGTTVTGQDNVDELVEAVRALWETPFDVVIDEDAQLVQRTESARWFAQLLRAVGAPREVEQRTEEVLEALEQRINAELNLRENPPTNTARSLADYVNSTRTRNEGDSVATEVERGFAHALNDYRHMLGLEPLTLMGALTEASRVHSVYMGETGQFAHNLSGHPYGETPADRAARFNYSGALGENIAMHSNGFTPDTALAAWYGSPDHHRNMLHEAWTRIGVGVSETNRYWTTKFGR